MVDAPRGMATPGQEVRLRAIGLARVLNIPPSSFTARERQALAVLSNLAAMPTERDHARRRAFGNEILQNANRLLPMDQPQNAQFNARVRELVITMQEFPAWYATLTKSNEDIVNDYVLVKNILWGMKLAGMGGLSALGGTVSGAVKGGLRAGQAVAGQGVRQVAMAGGRGAMTGAMGSATGGLAGPLAIAWVIGSVTYVALEARLAELGREITRRYQEQKLAAGLYQTAFGHDVALPERYFYPVR